MGKPQRKKRTHKNIKDFKKNLKTKKKSKDLDEIHVMMQPEKSEQYLHQKIDPDLPGEGQFYCLFCARYFINQKTLVEHKKTKNHKKRVRLLKDKPYTQAEAELAAGMGSYTIKATAPKTSKLKSNDTIENESITADILSPSSTMSNAAMDLEGLNI